MIVAMGACILALGIVIGIFIGARLMDRGGML